LDDQAQEGSADQPDEGGDDQADKADQGDGDQGAFLEALRMMRQLQEENRALAGQVGFLQAQLLHTQGQLEQAQSTIKVLEAPKLEEEPVRPWWRFW
jgi:hypothetical protein